MNMGCKQLWPRQSTTHGEGTLSQDAASLLLSNYTTLSTVWSTHVYLGNPCFFFFLSGHTSWPVEIPWPGSNSCPVLWKHRLNRLTTRENLFSFFNCLKVFMKQESYKKRTWLNVMKKNKFEKVSVAWWKHTIKTSFHSSVKKTVTASSLAKQHW